MLFCIDLFFILKKLHIAFSRQHRQGLILWQILSILFCPPHPARGCISYRLHTAQTLLWRVKIFLVGPPTTLLTGKMSVF